MKKIIILMSCIALLLGGCQKKGADAEPVKGIQKTGTTKVSTKKKLGQSLLPQAGGAPYELLVIMDNAQWERPVGRALFEVLDTDLPGVAQPERQFRMSRIDPSSFRKMYRIFRNIILLDIQNIYSTPKFKFARNTYAKGQMIMTLQAGSEEQLADYLQKNGQEILSFFTRAEFNREVQFLKDKHNPVASEKVQQIFGCDVWVPFELNKFKEGKDFFWASTNKGSKDMNIVVYTYPYTATNTFTLEYFMHKRDSVMKANIPGGPEGSYMSTQHQFVDVTDGTVKGEYAQIARGLWRVEGDHMGGPFVSHSRVDAANNRVVVIEGFVYAPESLKRNLIRTVEATLYTLALPNEQNVENFTFGLDEITINPDNN